MDATIVRILTFFLAVCVAPSVSSDSLPVVVNTWPFVDANEAGKNEDNYVGVTMCSLYTMQGAGAWLVL